MKSKTFGIWLEAIEKFLSELATEQVALDVLNNWMDTEGARLFQVAQKEYFDKHYLEYKEDAQNNPPPVRIDLASNQLAVGFEAVTDALLKNFPSLENEDNRKRCESLKTICLGDMYQTFIAVRAVITGQLVRSNEQDPKMKLAFTIDSYKKINEASQRMIDLLQPAPSIQHTIPRGLSSPVLHKKKEEQVISQVAHIEEKKNTYS